MSDLMARLRYYRCGDKECAEIAARATSEIERLRDWGSAEARRAVEVELEMGELSHKLFLETIERCAQRMETYEGFSGDEQRIAAAAIRALKDKTMIDRLRTWARNGHTPKALADDLKDAADEIERLNEHVTAVDRLANELHSENERLRAALAAERERCAQVAEQYIMSDGEDVGSRVAISIAAAIRARKD